jgi:hypothetical protein
MGCDIHLHIEVKIGDQWHHYGTPSIGRDYNLFEKMAGVRGAVDAAISPPKGLPKDCTFLTWLDHKMMKVDAHSASWLGPEEIDALEEWREKSPQRSIGLEYDVLHTYLFGNSFTGWKHWPEENTRRIQDVRFVFWFDN